MTVRDLKNGSKEAIALRHAASAWAAYKAPDHGDPEDRKGAAVNRRLLRAALAYAEVVEARFTIDQVMTAIHKEKLRKPAPRGRHA